MSGLGNRGSGDGRKKQLARSNGCRRNCLIKDASPPGEEENKAQPLRMAVKTDTNVKSDSRDAAGWRSRGTARPLWERWELGISRTSNYNAIGRVWRGQRRDYRFDYIITDSLQGNISMESASGCRVYTVDILRSYIEHMAF